MKIYFQAIRYRASGRGALGYRKFAKVFSAKIYFQAIRYRASGRGALGYRKFAKVFSAKICFQAIRVNFLQRKKPTVTVYFVSRCKIRKCVIIVCPFLKTTLFVGMRLTAHNFLPVNRIKKLKI